MNLCRRSLGWFARSFSPAVVAAALVAIVAGCGGRSDQRGYRSFEGGVAPRTDGGLPHADGPPRPAFDGPPWPPPPPMDAFAWPDWRPPPPPRRDAFVWPDVWTPPKKDAFVWPDAWLPPPVDAGPPLCPKMPTGKFKGTLNGQARCFGFLLNVGGSIELKTKAGPGNHISVTGSVKAGVIGTISGTQCGTSFKGTIRFSSAGFSLSGTIEGTMKGKSYRGTWSINGSPCTGKGAWNAKK